MIQLISKEKDNKKKAVERLQQLINTNFDDKKFNIKISYDNCSLKKDESLLMENR